MTPLWRCRTRDALALRQMRSRRVARNLSVAEPALKCQRQRPIARAAKDIVVAKPGVTPLVKGRPDGKLAHYPFVLARRGPREGRSPASSPAGAEIRSPSGAAPRACPPSPTRQPTAVVEQKRTGWKNPEQVRAWRNSLERYAFPRIGRMAVSEVASADVLAIIAPIWHTHKPIIAKAVRQRLHAVLEWAVAIPLVFTTGATGRCRSSGFARLLELCGIACVPHGFRSSFRDWAAEETDHPRDVIEAALAHVVQNRVEAAYARSDLFERRRRLMNDYMDASQRQGQPGVHGRADCGSMSGLSVQE